jgi:hypothetical protein
MGKENWSLDPQRNSFKARLLGMVVYVCNASYSGSGDWEGQGSRPAQAKIEGDPISKN